MVDASGIEEDDCTSGSSLVVSLSSHHLQDDGKDAQGDVFLWALEVLGPDLWHTFKETKLRSSMLWCLYRRQVQRMQRLLDLCKNINARVRPGGWSLLHMQGHRHLGYLLQNGADPNLAGFDLCASPVKETPISASMYRVDRFMRMQAALRSSPTSLEDICDMALKTRPFRKPSRWTKNILVELFSAYLDISRLLSLHLKDLLSPRKLVCRYCLYARDDTVQVHWMNILEAIKGKPRSQSVQQVVENVLRTMSRCPTESKEDPHVDSPSLTSHEKSVLAIPHVIPLTTADQDHEQLNNEPTNNIKFGDQSIDYKDEMCLFCWYDWQKTGLKPTSKEGTCLDCGRSLFSLSSAGRSPHNDLYCLWCVEDRANHVTRPAMMSIDPDDDEGDGYSPYLVHV